MEYHECARQLQVEIQRWFRDFLLEERQRWEAEEGEDGWRTRMGGLDEVSFMLVESVRHRVLAHSASVLVGLELEVERLLFGWPGRVNVQCKAIVGMFMESLRELLVTMVGFKGVEDDEGVGSEFLAEV